MWHIANLGAWKLKISKKWRKRLIELLAIVVVFATTYSLILPALTITQDVAEEEPGIVLEQDAEAAGAPVEETDEPAIDAAPNTAEDETRAPAEGEGEDVAVPAETDPAAPTEGEDEELEVPADPDAAVPMDQSADNADTVTADPAAPQADAAAQPADATTEPADAITQPANGDAEAPADQKTDEAAFKGGMLTASGKSYKITLTYTAEAEIPDGAALAVKEIVDNADPELTGYRDFMDYVGEAEDALKANERVTFARFFDIKIMVGEDEIQPAVPVDVKIELTNQRLNDDVKAVHFGDSVEVLDASLTEKSLNFEAKGFSVYGVLGTEQISVPFRSGDGSTYEVTVSYGAKANLPVGSRLKVSELTEADEGYFDYLAQAAEAVGGDADSLKYIKLLDISIVDSKGEKVDLGDPVDVSIRLMDTAKVEEDTQIVHFAGEAEVPEVIGPSISNDTVSFTTDGFSVYAVIGGTSPEARMKLVFKNGDTELATMYVKNGDTAAELQTIIYDPGVGELAPGTFFLGWLQDQESYDVEDIEDGLTIEDIRTWAEAEEINEGEEIPTHTFYAMIFTKYTVSYVDYVGEAHTEVAIGSDSAYALPSAGGTGTATTYKVYMSYQPDDSHNFEGWRVAEGGSNIVGHTDDTHLYKNDDEITITGDVKFAVEAPPGSWLVFEENGKGASYNAPVFVKEGEVTECPPGAEAGNMTRNGYTFDGWYTDKACTTPFNFGGTITSRTVIYAKWNPVQNAPYTVIFWTQNLDRNGYEVAGSVADRTGRVGTNIPYTFVNNGDEDYVTGYGNNYGHYTGFCLTEGSRNQQVAITPEGDAVLNLYYDRIEYNFKFYLYRDAGRNQYDYPNNSGSGSSLNDLVTWHSNQNAHPNVTAASGYTLQSETVGGRTYHYFVMQAYYGEDISAKWPKYDQITGANGREAVSFVMMVGTALKPNPTNQGSGTVKGIITVLNENILGATNDSNGNYVMVRFPTSYYNWRYHIWFETVDGEDYTGKNLHTHNGRTYYEEDVLVVRSSNTTDANQNEPKYSGFEYVTRLGQNNNGTVWQGGHWTTGNNPTLYHLNYIYNREKYSISYFDGSYVDGNGNQIQNRASHLLHESPEIGQGATIAAEYRNYVPSLPPGEVGYVFEGWYLDEGCTVPYTWDKMTVGGIKVYAKWRQIQYRVFLHPNADTDPSLDWGTETPTLNFRVAYGGTVSTLTGLRNGYEFKGWYTSPSLSPSTMFSSDVRLNESNVTTAYNKETDYTDPMDKWGNIGSGASNSDVNRFWITQRFDLYAKWAEVIEGADGIYVVYDAAPGTNPPTDPNLYGNQSPATAGVAPTPPPADANAPNGYRFNCWVVQDWNGTTYADTETKVFPGGEFTVDLQLAKQEPKRAEGEYTYTMQLRAEYVPIEEGVPTHIWWYPNYDAPNKPNTVNYVEGEVLDHEPQINEAVDIHEPLTRDGYIFLGWSRVVAQSGVDDQTALAVRNLTADDLFLKYEDGKWYAAETDDDGEIIKVDGHPRYLQDAVAMVAADERLQYHDLFAVWKKLPSLRLIKVDADSPANDPEYLGGAEFTLTYMGTGISPISLTSEADADGVDTDRGLEDGTWVLTETAPPPGYLMNTSTITLTVEDGVIKNGDTVLPMVEKTAEMTDDVFIITVENTAGHALPNSGGHGTLPYTLGGLALIATTALMYGFSRRRRERRFNE